MSLDDVSLWSIMQASLCVGVDVWDRVCDSMYVCLGSANQLTDRIVIALVGSERQREIQIEIHVAGKAAKYLEQLTSSLL